MSAIYCEDCNDSAFIIEHEDMIEISACECSKDLLVSAIQPVIDHINEGGSYAILKVAN